MNKKSGATAPCGYVTPSKTINVFNSANIICFLQNTVNNFFYKIKDSEIIDRNL